VEQKLKRNELFSREVILKLRKKNEMEWRAAALEKQFGKSSAVNFLGGGIKSLRLELGLSVFASRKGLSDYKKFTGITIKGGG